MHNERRRANFSSSCVLWFAPSLFLGTWFRVALYRCSTSKQDVWWRWRICYTCKMVRASTCSCFFAAYHGPSPIKPPFPSRTMTPPELPAANEVACGMESVTTCSRRPLPECCTFILPHRGQPSTHNRNISFSTMEHCTDVMRSRLSGELTSTMLMRYNCVSLASVAHAKMHRS